MRVLIVDDEPLVCDLLGDFLARRGYEVSTAVDGNEALRAIQARDSDLILLDLYLPNLDGLGVLRGIREQGLVTGTIWTMTGMGDHDAAEQSLSLGADDFLAKPVDLKHLGWRLDLEERRRI
jgi:DNA-binding response OmpR family regulator